MVLRWPRMRALIGSLLVIAAGCAVDDELAAPTPTPLDTVWERTIRHGDIVVLIPGTGSVEYLATPIEAMGSDHPVVDVRANELVRSDATVFEQAIAAARRAGITDTELESGALTFLLWGSGITKLAAFDYVSYEHLTIRVEVIGGQNACAVGLITDNYLNYSWTSADADARDVYTRVGGWLAAHPSGEPRNAVVMAHSWGGAVAEYLTLELETLIADLGVLPGATAMPFTVAAGVPAFVPGYEFIGPRALDFARPTGTRLLYEIDRPDDPVHSMTFDGDFGGHHYEIVVGGELVGFYGITTDEMSCHDQLGACE